jgi:hypothetical protein
MELEKIIFAQFHSQIHVILMDLMPITGISSGRTTTILVIRMTHGLLVHILNKAKLHPMSTYRKFSSGLLRA